MMDENVLPPVYLQIARVAFKPAKKLKRRTWAVTTETLAQKISENYPGVEIETSLLRETLLNNGYEQFLLPGIGYRWLLKPMAWPKMAIPWAEL